MAYNGSDTVAGSWLVALASSGAVSPAAAYLTLSKKLVPTPYTQRGLTSLFAIDSYLRTTAVTWTEVGLSFGLLEIE